MIRVAAGRRSWNSLAAGGLLSTAFLASLLGAGAARADEEQQIREEGAIPGRVTRQERPFGFLSDATTPSAGVVSMGYAFGLGSGISADRPLPVNLAAGATGSHTVSLGYGLTHRLAPFASATFSGSATTAGALASTVMAGATYQFTHPYAPLHVSLSGAVAHEGLSNALGVSALGAVSFAHGPLCLAANLRADRMFASGRDSVDVFTMLGFSYRVLTMLRLGAEYVGQDLEEMFGDEAEGGARHAAGPSVALDLDGGRYQLAVASGFGLTARSPRAVVRAVLAFNF